MNFPQRQMRDIYHEAGARLHDGLDDVSDLGTSLLERGRRLTRHGSRRLRNRADQVHDLATDLGDQLATQARRTRRQIERHPWAAIGVAAIAVAGIALLAQRAARRRREREVMAPDHDYFGNHDPD